MHGNDHLSIDDVIDLFFSLTVLHPKDIFEIPLLHDLLRIHQTYGIKTDLFVFWKNDKFCLKDCTFEYKFQFEKNSDWLKFGFHAYDGGGSVWRR